MHIEETQLESFIFDSGIVSRKDFEEAKKSSQTSGERVERVLISRGIIGNDDLRRIKAFLLGLPFVDLKTERLDFSTLSLIPEPISRNHNIIAFRKTGDSLEVALLETDEVSVIDFLRESTGLKVLPRLTDDESIKQALLLYQKSLKSEFGDILQKETLALNGIAIVDTLLKHALLHQASSIYIEPQENHMLVRYRVGGRLYDAMVLPTKSILPVVVRIKSLAGLSVEEGETPQEGRFNFQNLKETISFRVSTLPTMYGEKVSLRPIRENTKGFTLESLGFRGQGLEEVHESLAYPSGVVLITGPRNSGKTTTLYTMIDLVNTPSKSVSSIEDPIEYRMPRVNQTQVRPEVGLTLSSGLRTLMRQDPDVVMVGNLTNQEEINLALQASLKKCLVLAAVEGTSAAGTLSRLVGMKVDPLFLSSNLKVIVAERLVKKLTSTKTQYFLNKKELQVLGTSVDLERMLKILKQEKVVGPKATWEKIPFYKPGKEKEGFNGLVGLQEVLKVSPTIQHLIKDGGTTADLEVQAKKEGMTSLLEDGILKAAQGLTTIEEVLLSVS